MNLLHLCRQYFPGVGGVERFVAELSSRLAARGHRVEVVTLNRLWNKPGRLPAYEVVDGIPVHRLPFVGNALYFIAPTVIRLLSRFDMIHIHNTDFFLDSVALTRFIHHRQFVVSTHGGYFHTADFARVKRAYFALVTRHSLQAASVVIPNSAVDERKFTSHARRAVRIDNACDYAAFAAVKREPVPGRVITVGRLAPNKNLSALLCAVAEARRVRGDLSLTIVGDGPLRAELQTQAQALGLADSVRWLGEVRDAILRAELASAELFVSAATYEGFGLALLEAMAAGCVPVANDIDAFRDLISDGRNGFLVGFERSASAGQKIVEVLSLSAESKTQLSGQARLKAAAYDWAQVITKFEKVYSDFPGS